jgi:signal transduction histidine kinase/CheY-like chemotaxis protein
VNDLQPPDPGGGGDAAANAILPAGRLHHAGTWRHRRRDGSLLDVEITTHPIRVGGRDARLVIATDVTDRTRLETKLRQTQRYEALGRLAGGLAHEFNNLLAAVLAHAGLLNVAIPRGAVGADSVDEIIRATQRGAELTRHLLAFGRRQILRPESVDVCGVIRDTERLLRPLLTADVRVSMELPGACWARVDRSQLELVIMNLVMNARDAMPNGGSLTLETRVVELALADMERHPTVAIAPGEYVRLSISDSGVGIAPEIRDRVFEPFFTTKPVGRGTGLGLSTVYGIVKQSDGYVWLYSESGLGTTMHVYLPCAVAPAFMDETEGDATAPAARHSVGKATSRVPVPAGSRGITVLVADDEEALRRAAVRILSGAGYRVLDAADGESALAVAAAASTRVDVLLTDVVMPGMGGVALASRLAEREPRLRVIYMSGYPQRHLAGEAGLPGGHAFIEKPFSVDSLLQAMSEPRAQKRTRK